MHANCNPLTKAIRAIIYTAHGAASMVPSNTGALFQKSPVKKLRLFKERLQTKTSTAKALLQKNHTKRDIALKVLALFG